ncbi:MAG: exodeoxyribonuclease VII large subunit [Granulosicoccus sp.]
MNSADKPTAETTASRRKVFTVSRLNQEVLQLLEGSFGTVWLQGELSNFSRPGSGHFYFSLKDSRAQIRCAMFKGRNRYVAFTPIDGDAVLVRGKLSLYAARGDFQLIVEHMEPTGAGKLQAAFEATRRELDARGLFSTETKRALPTMPATIGVVTSPTGAAVRDVLQVLARRYPQARVIIYPTMTQGAQAAPEIVRALGRAAQRQECDVLLLVRGGGSLEDLWGFNEVGVAEAIHACPIPLVAGVGHEVDVTIADLVADLRAPTPSAAAELATPECTTLQLRTQSARQALSRAVQRLLHNGGNQLGSLTTRLQARHPQRLLADHAQRVDELDMQLRRAWRVSGNQTAARLQQLTLRLAAHSPEHALAGAHAALAPLLLRLDNAMQGQITRHRTRFELSSRALNAVSPLAILDRGYAVVRHRDTVLTNTRNVKKGDLLSIRLSTGTVESSVTKVLAERLHSKKPIGKS